MSCSVVCRCNSDLALLWLQYRLATADLIRPLAWEIPYAVSATLKLKEKREKKKKKERKHDHRETTTAIKKEKRKTKVKISGTTILQSYFIKSMQIQQNKILLP